MLLVKLVFAFIHGLFRVGGGYADIPLIQEQIVNTHALMTLEEFSDLIGSVGASILMLGLFQAELQEVMLGDIRFVELEILVVALFLLRKFKANAFSKSQLFR